MKANEFSNFHQRAGISVTEYEEKFKDLSRYAPAVSQGEEALARKFLEGLHPTIGRIVDLSQSRDVDILLEGRDPVRVLRVIARHRQLGVPKVRVLGARASSVLPVREGILGLGAR